jgi:hypothetical protein
MFSSSHSAVRTSCVRLDTTCFEALHSPPVTRNHAFEATPWLGACAPFPQPFVRVFEAMTLHSNGLGVARAPRLGELGVLGCGLRLCWVSRPRGACAERLRRAWATRVTLLGLLARWRGGGIGLKTLLHGPHSALGRVGVGGRGSHTLLHFAPRRGIHGAERCSGPASLPRVSQRAVCCVARSVGPRFWFHWPAN